MDKPGIRINIGIVGLLTIIFVIFKLTHVIDWPWWVVLIGVWLPWLVIAIITLLVLACFGVWSIGVLRGWW